MSYSSDEEYTVPLQDKRVFGAGLKRKRVKFIPAASTITTASTIAGASTEHSDKELENGGSVRKSAAERYLDIVLQGQCSSEATSTATTALPAVVIPSTSSTPNTNTAEGTSLQQPLSKDSKHNLHQEQQQQQQQEEIQEEIAEEENIQICPICNIPLTTSSSDSTTSSNSKNKHRPHEASLPHQLSLPHSHPPSAVNRNSNGLKYLQAYGWDPDSRAGLGRGGTGIRHPVKAVPKFDTVGLGVGVSALSPAAREALKKQTKPKLLDAKKVRELELSHASSREKMRRVLFADDDVEKYLGVENV
jgi:hypothetical protein